MTLMTNILEQTKHSKKQKQKNRKFCLNLFHDPHKGNAKYAIEEFINVRRVYFGAECIEDELLTYL